MSGIHLRKAGATLLLIALAIGFAWLVLTSPVDGAERAALAAPLRSPLDARTSLGTGTGSGPLVLTRPRPVFRFAAPTLRPLPFTAHVVAAPR